jgi:cytochrome c oxidase cbb3-type subunit 3
LSKAIVLALTMAVGSQLFAQTPPARPPGRAARPAAYPDRAPADPAVLARGKALYGVYCNFCHGSDARGGEGGPNLLRSELVLNDQQGEAIAPVVRNGRGEMPKLNLSTEQISDIAVFIHSLKVSGNEASRMLPPSVLVGDATAGAAVFQTKCVSCHSVTGDLKGIGGKFADAKLLQNHFLMPGGRGGGRGGAPQTRVSPTTVIVALPSGQKIEGRLVRIDDFIVTLVDSEGLQHTFRRDGDVPRVELHDPRKPHRDLLPAYTDKEIHDLTAYLVTVK